MTRFEYLFRRFAERPARLPEAVRTSIGRRVSPRFKSCEVVLQVGADGRALGDNLMLTTVAREIRKRNPAASISVVTNHPEVFRRNPDISSVIPLSAEERARHRDSLVTYKQGFPYARHFIHYCCECVGIRSPVDLRTYIYPSTEDHAWAEAFVADLTGAPILISRAAGSHAYRKTWPHASWTALIANLSRRSVVVDVGAAGEPAAQATGKYVSLLGRTTVHQLAALMMRSAALIGIDSGLIHLAAAADLPTICLLGGVFPPAALHYPRAKVLVDRPHCRDCAPLRHCHHNAKCLSSIGVSDVLTAFEAISNPNAGVHSNGVKRPTVPVTADVVLAR
jgi:ADP-heptose:LPS heptosyltransferase